MEAVLTQALATNAQVAPFLIALVVFVWFLWYRAQKIEEEAKEKEDKHVKCREENAIKFHGMECLILNGINDIKLQLAEAKGRENGMEKLAMTITQEMKKAVKEKQEK